MNIKKFEDIESWKQARILTNQIYDLTKTSKLKFDYGLKDQIQRASVSIMNNIAEGFDSGSTKAFINFLNYSYRSSSEVQSLLYILLDQKHIDNETFSKLYNSASEIKKLIGGFIKYLKSTTKN
ncbi:MAG: four helix bundle protein [Bacteroidetes bacterium]|nr:four helix bundle protein [Bacteroidota bacterium]